MMVGMRIVIAGASGFLGTHLATDLTARGHDVIRLVRREARGSAERTWDPAASLLDPAVLADADAVINLAGATVSRRWTARYRRTISRSRTDTTSTIAAAAAAARRPGSGTPPSRRPAILLNASAVGFYGDTGERIVDESSPAGEGFLSEVCQVWEAATRPAEDAGARVAMLRTGLVLARDGGLLQPLQPLFKLGVGGRMGNGRQYWPWISLTDWLAAVRTLLVRDDLAGPVNLVGPQPVTNAEFTTLLGRVLGRPAMLPAPAPLLRAALGGFASEVLDSHRVLPTTLTRAGFEFRHTDAESALRTALDPAS